MSNSSVNIELSLPDMSSSCSSASQTVGLRVDCEGESFYRRIPRSVAKRLQKALSAEARSFQTVDEFEAYLRELEDACARQKVEFLIEKRDYSCRELADKLSAAGYSADTVAKRLKHSQLAGLVDDQRYARLFISSKKSQGQGMLKIRYELKNKGIEVQNIPGWPEEFFPTEEEYERAAALAALKFKHVHTYKESQKVLRFLSSRGFPQGIAASVARAFLDES